MANQTPELVLKGLSQRVRRAFNDTLKPAFTKKIAKIARDQLVKRTRLGFGVDSITGNQVKLIRLSKNYIKVRQGKLRFYTNKKTKKIFTVPKGLSAKQLAAKAEKAKAAKARKAARATKTVFELDKFNVRLETPKRKKRKKVKPARAKRLSSKTSPGKSNLTATGGMLKSIKYIGLQNRIVLEIPSKAHGPDLFGNKKDITHSELARIHQKGATIKHPSGARMKIPKRRFFDLTTAEKNKILRAVRQSVLKKYRKR